MKKKCIKKILIFTIATIALLFINTVVQAASATIEVSNNEVEVGDEAIVNVSFTAAAWNLSVSGDKIKCGSYAQTSVDLTEVTVNKTYNVDTSTPGIYKITLMGDITDKDGNITDVEKSVFVKVKEKSIEPEEIDNLVFENETLTKNDLKRILNKISNKIELDISNNEYEKVVEKIKLKIEEMLINNNIEFEETYNSIILTNKKNEDGSKVIIKIKFLNGCFEGTFGNNDFKKANITFNNVIDENLELQKEIELIYNNSSIDNYNLEDEDYIQNLKINIPDYFEYNIENIEFKDYNSQSNIQFNLFPTLVKEYIEKALKDESIQVECKPISGDISYINSYECAYVKLYKNNTLYNVLSVYSMSIPVITVPSEINDEDMINYALNIVKEKFKDNGIYDTEKFSIEKGTEGKIFNYYNLENINDGYKILYNNTDEHAMRIIIKRKYQLGDVNEDGKINALDATLILKYVAKKKDLTEEQLKLADVTKDKKVNALDAVKILKYVAKKISQF